MKISEMFMVRSAEAFALLSSASPAAAPTSGAGAVKAAAAVTGLNLRARLEPELAFGDDHLAGLESLLDDDVLADALTDGDRLLIHRAVVLHDEDELAVLARLDRLA